MFDFLNCAETHSKHTRRQKFSIFRRHQAGFMALGWVVCAQSLKKKRKQRKFAGWKTTKKITEITPEFLKKQGTFFKRVRTVLIFNWVHQFWLYRTKRYFTEMRKEVRGLKSVPWHRSGWNPITSSKYFPRLWHSTLTVTSPVVPASDENIKVLAK